MTTVSDSESLEFDPSEESEDDLHASPTSFSQAVVAGTDWTVETLLNQVRRGNIELNPSFQRRDAWTVERKSRFVESLILGLPVPQLVLAERRDKRGSYIVIDGKQRILSLAQFVGQGESGSTGFRLKGLATRTDLNRQSYADLAKAEGYDDLTAFENATIRTVVIRGWPDEDFLYLIFLRLNTGSVPLSPQELRQALHPGGFVDFVDRFSYESPGLRRVLNLSKPDFRMRDAELLVRYYAFSRFLPDYAGDLKRFLDDTCKRLNIEWKDDLGQQAITQQGVQLEAAIATTYEVFGPDAFRRHVGAGRYEPRFNRAIFDLMVIHFADPQVAQAARSNAPGVRTSFEQLSLKREFADATSSTTKSLLATFVRFRDWTDALSEATGMRLNAFEMQNGRISRKS